MAFGSRALAVLVTGLFILSGCDASAPAQDGPLVIRSAGKTVSGIHASAGQRVAFGYNIMENNSNAPIENISATLIPVGTPSLPVQIRQILVTELDTHRLSFLGIGPWPSEDIPLEYTRDLQSYVLNPDGKAVEIIFVLDVEGGGRAFWSRTQISYDHRGERYVKTVENGLAICAPPSLKCEPPD